MSNIERYDYAFDPDGDAWAARILRRLPSTGCRVLELGPGPGAMSKVMVAKGHSVVAIENDDQALNALYAIGVEVMPGDLDTADWSTGLASRQFDAVLACDVLEHLRHPEVVLQNLRQHVQPTGKLIVSVPNIAYGGVLAALRCGAFDYTDKGQLDRTHVRFFTRRSFESVLIGAGWIPVAWEANRVPLESSEFAWHWLGLPVAAREGLMEGWQDFDVYQWMVEAVPATDLGWQRAALADVVLAQEAATGLKRELDALRAVHQHEHDSLIEHQKAFAEAKIIIEQLRADAEAVRLLLAQQTEKNERLIRLADETHSDTLVSRLRRWLKP